jgi:predicted nuclease with TOPRIM domain
VLNGLCHIPRCKHAKTALRGLKSEAREAGKLLEDKKALEQKLKEVQATLEMVQGQRNELREEVKKALKSAEKDQEARRVSLRSSAGHSWHVSLLKKSREHCCMLWCGI